MFKRYSRGDTDKVKSFYKVGIFYIDKESKQECQHEFYITAIDFKDACDKSKSLALENWNAQSCDIVSCVPMGSIYV